MKTYRIPNTDLITSRIGYGCNQLISKIQNPSDTAIISTASNLVKTAVDQGIRIFDMAAMYSDGKVETVFGAILRKSPELRKRIVIQTKCGAIDNANWKTKGDPAFLFDSSRDGILRSVEGSLSRLGVEQIDILLLHWPDLLLRPEEVAQAFDELQKTGKVRYFGVSNYTAVQIELLKKYVKQPLVANQIYVGLGDSYYIASGIQQLEQWGSPLPHRNDSFNGIIDYCRLQDIQIQAYQPIGGILRDKILSPPANARPEVKAASQLLLTMAEEKNTTPLVLAMAWLLHHPANILAFTGSSDPAHIIENCRADSIVISRDEWFKLFFAVAAVQSSSSWHDNECSPSGERL